MSERIDHVATAKKILGGVEQLEGSQQVSAAGSFALAHATLALVEQQRIANLIAYCEVPENEAITPRFKRNLHRSTIREALGMS